MSVFVSVTLERQQREALDRFETQVGELPEIMSGFLGCPAARTSCSAAWCAISITIESCSNAFTQIPGVAHVQSSFALKTFINRPAPLISESRVRRAR
jgi:DNA-binding Lrp family transcriptional regulator